MRALQSLFHLSYVHHIQVFSFHLLLLDVSDLLNGAVESMSIRANNTCNMS